MKKINKYLLLLIMGILCVCAPNAYAKVLTADEILEAAKNADSVKKLNEALEEDEKLDFVLNEDKTILKFKSKDFEMDYRIGEDYIEYANRDVTITVDEAKADFDRIIGFSLLLEGIYDAAGHKGIAIDNDKEYTNDYDTYGLSMETEDYNFEEDGVKGSFMRYVKQSLDTDKIDKFATDFCKSKEEETTVDKEEEKDTEVSETGSENPNEEGGSEVEKGEDATEEEVENPSTGVEEPILILGLIALGTIAFLGLKKKSAFNRI